MSVKPGDLFQWMWLVRQDRWKPTGRELYSHTMEKYVPCNGMCLCISVENAVIHWIYNGLLFHADTSRAYVPVYGVLELNRVIPLKIEL